MAIFAIEEFEKWTDWFDKNQFSPEITQILKKYKEKTNEEIIETKDIFNKTRIPEKIKNIFFSSKRGDEFMLLTKKYNNIYFLENISYLFPKDKNWIQILTSLFDSDRKIEEIDNIFYLIISSISQKIIRVRDNIEFFNPMQRATNVIYIQDYINNPDLERKLKTNRDNFLETGNLKWT